MRWPAPLWLRQPSRFAAIGAARARMIWFALSCALAISLQALFLPSPEAAGGDGQGDLILYQDIVAGIVAGGGYYEVTADLLRAGGYPLRPFLTFRLPTLAMVQALLPQALVAALMIALASVTGWVWLERLRRDGVQRLAPLAITAMLLAAGLIGFVQTGLAAFHEFWAAPLIALSLALWHRDRWVTAVAIGLCAALIRETAALYLLVMGGIALLEGARREALGWGIALAVFALVVVAHAFAVAGVVSPIDAQSPGWAGLNGPGLFVRSVTLATALQLAPLWLAAPVVALAMFGWAAWRDPLGLRVFAVIGAYAVVIAAFGRLDTFYWGVMAAPLLLAGLVFVPDALRDLARSALDRRRVRVHRTTR
ncbi:glycosyltransferase family protein [Sphingomonas baiyangensis]|uniref:DUF2029 domain-containing protein n=1 Tax=Sphingomonas baiyangensis TaxID=2572576 RepID=A0A4U1L322_9SPHN|nr:DUF2079 domain-containing protein [Sphingomonas baiyangensis]TKD51042.1 hypothetical protein FBR43_09940 [Sphingomonas baiyangensis]